MRFIYLAGWLVLAASSFEALWCILMLKGIIRPPTQIADVMHDTYYSFAAASQFLKLVCFVMLGAIAAILACRLSPRKAKLRRIAASLALSGATIAFTAINWLIMRPAFFQDMPRRMPDAEEYSAIESIARIVHQAMLLGIILIGVSFLILLWHWIRRDQA